MKAGLKLESNGQYMLSLNCIITCRVGHPGHRFCLVRHNVVVLLTAAVPIDATMAASDATLVNSSTTVSPPLERLSVDKLHQQTISMAICGLSFAVAHLYLFRYVIFLQLYNIQNFNGLSLNH